MPVSVYISVYGYWQRKLLCCVVSYAESCAVKASAARSTSAWLVQLGCAVKTRCEFSWSVRLGFISFHFGMWGWGYQDPSKQGWYFQRRAPMSLLHIFSQPLSLAIAVEDLKGKSPLLKSFFLAVAWECPLWGLKEKILQRKKQNFHSGVQTKYISY